jgi:hypothetical protein
MSKSRPHEDICNKSFHELERFGILLLSDPQLPCITTLVAGRPIRGSWWGHPKGDDVFRVASWIDEHPDVAVTKLMSGKVTFIHRKLWPSLLAVAMTREPWQLKGLSRKGKNLLQIVDYEEEIQAHQLPTSTKVSSSEWCGATRELENRLLIYAEELHSESGAHVKRLESWRHWAKRKKMKSMKMKIEDAKQQLSEITIDLNNRLNAKARLPWFKS